MAVPVLTSLSPASGPTAGGTTVTIAGSNLSAVTAVTFDGTPAADFAILSATQIVAIAPAESGIVDVVATNADGDSGALVFQFVDGLFTVAEARAALESGTAPLADAGQFSDDAILDAEEIVRARFSKACRTAFLPTVVTETLDGNATNVLRVARKNPAHEIPRRALSVISASIDGTALTVTELAALKCSGDGRIVRTDGSSWSSSTSYQDLAVEVTYTYGWASVPDLIKRAALLYAIRILAQGELPLGARDYGETGPGPRFPYPGKRPHWTGDDEVDAILVEFEEDTVAIA